MLKYIRLKYFAAALVMTGLATPQAARADLHQAVGAVLMICLLNPNACGGNGGKKGGGGGGGAAHEVAMNKQQKMYVQQGLASLGVYSGAIDGAFGRQTAASVQQYQRAIGHAATGRLTKPQVTDLMARAPRFRDLPADSPQLFEIEFVRVPRPDLAQVQQQLNLIGYNAGTPDGVFGKRTRNSIAAYKRDYGLAGPPEATARLLARLRGDTPPPFALMAIVAPEFAPGYRPPAVMARADDGVGGAGGGVRGVTDPTLPVKADGGAVADTDQGTLTELAAKVEDEPEVLPDTPVIVEVSDLDILSMRTGITQDAALAIAKEELPNGYFQETATAESMGGDKIHSFGLHIAEASFPEPFTSRLTLIYDEAFPDLGAMAIFREIALPEGLTLEQIERDIVPSAVESYGMEARFGDKLIWVSDGEARGEIGTDLVLLDECGSYRMDYSQRGADGSDTWEAGGGPQLIRDSLTSVVRGCGDVLAIEFSESAITFALWNTDMILDQMAIMGTPPAKEKGGLAGKIKF